MPILGMNLVCSEFEDYYWKKTILSVLRKEKILQTGNRTPDL